jgi:hypothetical protein
MPLRRRADRRRNQKRSDRREDRVGVPVLPRLYARRRAGGKSREDARDREIGAAPRVDCQLAFSNLKPTERFLDGVAQLFSLYLAENVKASPIGSAAQEEVASPLCHDRYGSVLQSMIAPNAIQGAQRTKSSYQLRVPA